MTCTFTDATSLLHLPTEILYYIYDSIYDPSTFYALSRTCSILFNISLDRNIRMRAKNRMKKIVEEDNVTYHILPNGVKFGEHRQWHYNGVLHTQCYFVDGKEHGAYSKLGFITYIRI